MSGILRENPSLFKKFFCGPSQKRLSGIIAAHMQIQLLDSNANNNDNDSL